MSKAITYQEHFLKCWPNEGVGYLKKGKFYPLENLAEDQSQSFEVDPKFLLKDPDALLHSHCVGTKQLELDARTPSSEDLKNQIATAIEWGIVVTDGQVCDEPVWWGNPNHRPPLEDREFIFNIQDCYALVQDWYFNELGIELPNGTRTPFWAQEGENLLEGRYEEWGFTRVPLEEVQRGDILFYQVRTDNANHIGIFLGDNKVLSHWFGRISGVEDYGRWAKYIKFAARYKND